MLEIEVSSVVDVVFRLSGTDNERFGNSCVLLSPVDDDE